jgi:hypothetical protein
VKERVWMAFARCTLHVAIEVRVNDIQLIRYPIDREILDVDGVEVVNQQYLAIGN